MASSSTGSSSSDSYSLNANGGTASSLNQTGFCDDGAEANDVDGTVVGGAIGGAVDGTVGGAAVGGALGGAVGGQSGVVGAGAAVGASTGGVKGAGSGVVVGPVEREAAKVDERAFVGTLLGGSLANSLEEVAGVADGGSFGADEAVDGGFVGFGSGDECPKLFEGNALAALSEKTESTDWEMDPNEVAMTPHH